MSKIKLQITDFFTLGALNTTWLDGRLDRVENKDKREKKMKEVKKGGEGKKVEKLLRWWRGRNIHGRLVPSSLEFTHFGSNGEMGYLAFLSCFFSSLPAIIPTFSHLSLTAPRAATPATAPYARLTFYYFIPTSSHFFFPLSLSADISLRCKPGCLSSLISKQAPIPQRSLYLPIQPTLSLIPGLLAVCQE